MKITRRQLRRIIKEEFAMTAAEEAAKVNRDLGDTPGASGSLSEDPAYWEKYDIITGEDLAIDLVAGTYSDMYKSIHNRRPRESFNSYEEVQAALQDLERYYEGMVERDELDAQAQAEYERERKELAAMMPTPLEKQYDKLPSRSGMGRRQETIGRVKDIICEELQREIHRRRR
jgi:hypothetical protein